MFYRSMLLFSLMLLLLPHSVAQEDCSSALRPRLRAGMTAETSAGQPNNIRDASTTSADQIGQIPPRSQFQVLSEAVCAEGYYWYQVDYQGLVGWTVEGAEGEYWLLPVLSQNQIIRPDNLNQLQVLNEFTCPEEDEAIPYDWSPDGTRLLWGCQESRLSVFDWISQENLEIQLDDFTPNRVYASFFADGSKIMLRRGTRLLYFDALTGEALSQHSLEEVSTVNSHAQYGNLLALGNFQQVFLYDLESLELLAYLHDERLSYVQSLAFSPDGTRLVLGGNAYLLLVWDWQSDERLIIETDYSSQDIAFSPSGRYLVAALCVIPDRGNCDQVNLTWFNLERNEIGVIWQEEGWHYISDIQFSDDLVLLQVNARFELMQISSDTHLYSSEGRTQAVLLSIDGRLLLSGEENRLLIYGIPQ